MRSVKPKFLNILKTEKCLLTEEEDDSDFEHVEKKKDTKEEEFDYELKTEIDNYVISTKEQRVATKKEMKLLRKNRKEMTKKVRNQERMRAEESLFDEGWQGVEVKLLNEEATKALQSDIEDWPIVEVAGLPQQANGDDCGVFVLKFMEVVLSNEPMSWNECSSWPAETAKFRAEIAANLLATFSEIS
ncbi:hypothetical protein KSP40_PGU016892 [Platanthera guangdongensis]|uniref:Ubiquitin-like protease family profile domain-containing protein n=1 Tax=Platanthera guangdongensis TaxID=2320717 RepID=A0ABR2N2K5_9ASPA